MAAGDIGDPIENEARATTSTGSWSDDVSFASVVTGVEDEEDDDEDDDDEGAVGVVEVEAAAWVVLLCSLSFWESR
jgi:hypothetical protein